MCLVYLKEVHTDNKSCYKCMEGERSNGSEMAHKYCTHPEDKEANFQCDHCTEEVKPFPSTANLPKNELTKNLEEELLRRMRRFYENAMFTFSQENSFMDIDKLPAKVKENFDAEKKLKFAARTISVSQKINNGDCCTVQWLRSETTTPDKNCKKWIFLK